MVVVIVVQILHRDGRARRAGARREERRFVVDYGRRYSGRRHRGRYLNLVRGSGAAVAVAAPTAGITVLETHGEAVLSFR